MNDPIPAQERAAWAAIADKCAAWVADSRYFHTPTEALFAEVVPRLLAALTATEAARDAALADRDNAHTRADITEAVERREADRRIAEWREAWTADATQLRAERDAARDEAAGWRAQAATEHALRQRLEVAARAVFASRPGAEVTTALLVLGQVLGAVERQIQAGGIQAPLPDPAETAQLARLAPLAATLGVPPATLLRMAVDDLLEPSEPPSFAEALDYTMAKNAELYRRLAAGPAPPFNEGSTR